MRRYVGLLLAVTVALVLADSAIVVLALPDILRHLDATVGQVAWVLISFNLVLGVAAVPLAVTFARLPPRLVAAAGIATFAVASTGCAAAGSIEVLIAARCLQALGGALVLAGSLDLLDEEYGAGRGLRVWILAGVVGTAAGPFVGGLLTEALSWQSVFYLQVPLAVLAVPAALSVATSRTPVGRRDRPALRSNLALGLLSAALTAALFLLVLLLVEGWRSSPGEAALTVSVLALAALVAPALARVLSAPGPAEVAAGCLAVAGGLTALAIPPEANLAWTIAPQVLVGLGIGLTLDQLTLTAVHERDPLATHAAWTIAARHLGVVAGLALLTPVFTADLIDAEVPAQEAIASLVLDAPIEPEAKVELARSLGDLLTEERGRIPDLSSAFAEVRFASTDRAEAAQLEVALDSQLERAATRAFRDSFLLGAVIAMVALVVVAVPPWRRRP